MLEKFDFANSYLSLLWLCQWLLAWASAAGGRGAVARSWIFIHGTVLI